MNDKILHPNFTLGEPNLNSAIKKNEENLCAMHLCNNKLGDPPARGYYGVFICNECRKSIDEIIQEEEMRENERVVKMLIEIIENQKNKP